jgi:hypothetical protein
MGHPTWSGKPLSEMIPRELAEAIVYLESSGSDDEPLLQALHDELARRIAAEPVPARRDDTIEGRILNGRPPVG